MQNRIFHHRYEVPRTPGSQFNVSADIFDSPSNLSIIMQALIPTENATDIGCAIVYEEEEGVVSECRCHLFC